MVKEAYACHWRRTKMEDKENISMKLYLAPMEGITGYLYRNVQHRLYNHIDKYFTPFITPTQNRKLTSREVNDILPEHNEGMQVVPQILTNQADGFLWVAQKAKELGYQEVNLNLGCPSGTVVSKGRGAGFLADPWKLERFLDQICEGITQMGMQLSVKTRIGVLDPEEFCELMEVFNRCTLSELIIHPRIRTDYYKNHPNLEVYRDAVRRSRNPLCYNGDIFDADSYREFCKAFPDTDTVMIGRGMIAYPGLAGEIRTGEGADKLRLKAFHDELLASYREVIPGDKNVLFKMKELWFYLACDFEHCEKQVKKIKKAGRMEEYVAAVELLFAECAVREHAGFRPVRG